MTLWIIHPHDPLIFRDGRPFDTTPGARAESLPFPLPSTTTGAVRTRAGQDMGGVFPHDNQKLISRLLEGQVRGPLLVRLDTIGTMASLEDSLLAPAPADALLMECDPNQPGHAERRRLVPLELFEGTESHPLNADAKRVQHPDWHLVGQPRNDQRKPLKGAPRFWCWEKFQEWLIEPSNEPEAVELSKLGVFGPTPEQRMHVSINATSGTADEGMLFQTNGLEFVYRCDTLSAQPAPSPQLSTIQHLALLVNVEGMDDEQLSIREGYDTLGGERRLVHWQKADTILPPCPTKIAKTIAEQGACRVVLLTPAYFEQGALPKWLLQERAGIRPQLWGMAVQRPQVVSGWDYVKRQPKPSHRLAPAGSVYFLKLAGNEAARRQWIQETWMQNVSDDANQDEKHPEQWRRDGFGLAVLGTWDGKERKMEL